LAGCSSNDMSNMPGMDHGSANAPTSTSPSASGGAPSATPAAGPHNDADVMFASMMIPHHQQAIEMADLVLAKEGINTEVADLARQIKAAQAPEITQMSGWLAGWGENPSPSMPMDHGMGGGMMSQADMDALEKATGDEAARLFLAGMIEHHTGAIAMAQQEIHNGQNPDAKQLAQDIVDAQQAEIITMNRLLDQL
ncbi:MAG TPA: DUF305 domain-containing protein, partial [Microlunatus sp.]